MSIVKRLFRRKRKASRAQEDSFNVFNKVFKVPKPVNTKRMMRIPRVRD